MGSGLSQGGKNMGRKQRERVAGRRDGAEQAACPSQGISSSPCLILWTLTVMTLECRPLKGICEGMGMSLGGKAWSQAQRLLLLPFLLPHLPTAGMGL